MKRPIEDELNRWKAEPLRMPLLIRGARHVGKSFTIEKFGKENFVQTSQLTPTHNKRLFSRSKPQKNYSRNQIGPKGSNPVWHNPTLFRRGSILSRSHCIAQIL